MAELGRCCPILAELGRTHPKYGVKCGRVPRPKVDKHRGRARSKFGQRWTQYLAPISVECVPHSTKSGPDSALCSARFRCGSLSQLWRTKRRHRRSKSRGGRASSVHSAQIYSTTRRGRGSPNSNRSGCKTAHPWHAGPALATATMRASGSNSTSLLHKVLGTMRTQRDLRTCLLHKVFRLQAARVSLRTLIEQRGGSHIDAEGVPSSSPDFEPCRASGRPRLRTVCRSGRTPRFACFSRWACPRSSLCADVLANTNSIMQALYNYSSASAIIQRPTGQCISCCARVTHRTKSTSRLFHSCLSWATSCQGTSNPAASTMRCVGFSQSRFPKAMWPRKSLWGPEALREQSTALIETLQIQLQNVRS